MTSPGSLRISPATEHDVRVVLALINELAVYEKMTDQVVATEDDIRRSLFGAPPEAEALVARVDDEVVGFALFFHNYSTFLGRRGLYLEDLYVRPAARGRGYGRGLLAALARIAVARGCGRMEWAVLDWNELAIQSYRRAGAKPQNDWTVWRLTGHALDDLAESE